MLSPVITAYIPSGFFHKFMKSSINYSKLYRDPSNYFSKDQSENSFRDSCEHPCSDSLRDCITIVRSVLLWYILILDKTSYGDLWGPMSLFESKRTPACDTWKFAGISYVYPENWNNLIWPILVIHWPQNRFWEPMSLRWKWPFFKSKTKQEHPGVSGRNDQFSIENDFTKYSFGIDFKSF